MEIISLHCFLCSHLWVYLGYLWTANTHLCKSHSRRWDRSLVGGRRMTLFCLGTVPPRMEPHNGLHSLTPAASWRFLLWQADVWDPHPPAPQWDFQSVRPPSGAMSHARPSSNPSIPTFSKSPSSWYRGGKSSFVVFYLFFLLWWIALIPLCNQSGFFDMFGHFCLFSFWWFLAVL